MQCDHNRYRTNSALKSAHFKVPILKCFFKKWAILGFILVFSIHFTVNVDYKILPMPGSNLGPLETEKTALPTEPQPLLQVPKVFKCQNVFHIVSSFYHFKGDQKSCNSIGILKG